jgi:HPt (histidine-containing phosphotransfer) domain-containing protein
MIEGALAASGPAPSAATKTTRVETILDQETLLARIDSDAELLQELIEVFFDDYPRLLTNLRQAITEGNNQALMQTAHTLKGALSEFSARAAWEAALELERLGLCGDFQGAEAACAVLVDAIDDLKHALASLGV